MEEKKEELKNVLLISDNEEWIKSLTFNFDVSKYSFNLECINYTDFFLWTNFIERVDLIIFDNSHNELIHFPKEKFVIPTIVVEDNIPKEITFYKDIKVISILSKVNKEKLFLNIELSLEFIFANKKIIFNGLHYEYKNKLLYKDGKLVELTNNESKIMKLLTRKLNLIVTYEDIIQYVWKEKKFSIHSLRNIVRNIRIKTDCNFIRNISNRGYVIYTDTKLDINF